MFRKLKRKFVILATAGTFLLMLILVAVMNTINYFTIVSDSDEVLDMLMQAKTQFSAMPADVLSDAPSDAPADMPSDAAAPDFSVPRGMSPEVPYESRYFMALVNSDGEVIRSDLTNIVTVDSALMKEYAAEAFGSGQSRAFIGEFRYEKAADGALTCILFLDCGRKLDAFRNFLLISSAVGIAGCLLVFVLFLFVSGRIVSPIAESYERQKRFITDAGHEIKTPLTIISTNLDLLEDDVGEKEEFSDIRLQTKRLTELTNNLVLLSKMEETGSTAVKVEFPVSDIVKEAVDAFSAVAKSRNKSLTSQVQPDVTLHGSPDGIRQLIYILLDNAMKYSPENGFIAVHMSQEKKNVILTVYNSTDRSVRQEELSHIFERFYRTDSSRNSETGGHGIGLSIAKTVTDSHGGTITASTKGGNDFSITVTLPL